MRIILLVRVVARIAEWVAVHVCIANPVVHSIVEMSMKPNVWLTVDKLTEVDG
ncbi:hypothetical protein D3C86_2252680 [compost metagenome]